MARSIIGGLVKSGFPDTEFHVSDPSQEQLDLFNEFAGVSTYTDNNQCLSQCDIVILAVKPQIMKQALQSITGTLRDRKPLLISIAAGILVKDILNWSETSLSVIRVMPNTPALINSGVSGLYANQQSSNEEKKTAEKIMQAVGPTIWVNQESDIDVVTGISGSGPAYFFKLMEIMINSAQSHGLDAESAKTLVLQTALGAAKLASQAEVDPRELRRQVTSPKGTTEAAINAMEKNSIEATVESGIQAAIDRSEELAQILGES